MQAKDWIAFGLIILVAIFFIAAYFFKPPTPATAGIIRIFCALISGAAGMVLAGTIAVQIQGQISAGTNLAVQAGGAIALFVLVWFTYPKPDTLTPGFNVSFPNGTTFKQAGRLIADASQTYVSYVGFLPQEEGIGLEQLHLRTADAEAALKQLANLVPSGTVRPYSVTKANEGYSLKPT